VREELRDRDIIDNTQEIATQTEEVDLIMVDTNQDNNCENEYAFSEENNSINNSINNNHNHNNNNNHNNTNTTKPLSKRAERLSFLWDAYEPHVWYWEVRTIYLY
jgi:hypothetical protein